MKDKNLFIGISKNDIKQAIARVNEEGYPPSRKSSTYDLVDQGVNYPPKYILALAGYFRDGNFIHEKFSGGEETEAFTFLKKQGFKVENKNETQSNQPSQANKEIDMAKYEKVGKNEHLNILWLDYLKIWPIDRLKSMSINEYTNLNKDDSLCYWLESRTQDLGSIWGGSAYKFGIYKRNNKEKIDKRKGYLTDGEYSWVAKYGTNLNEAFEKVRDLIVEIAEAAAEGSLESVDHIDIGYAVKWKIAALYNQKIPNIFKKEWLIAALESFGINKSSVSSDHQRYLKILPYKEADEDIISFSQRVWALAQKSFEEGKIIKDKLWYDLARVVQLIGKKDHLNKFFDVVATVLDEYNLDSNDKRTYAAALTRERRIQFTCGGIYIVEIELKNQKANFGFYGSKDDFERLKKEYPDAVKVNQRTHSGEVIGTWVEINPDKFNLKADVNSIIEAAGTELNVSSSHFRSQYERLHNHWIYDAAIDKKLRKELLEEDFKNEKKDATKYEDMNPIPLNQILYGPPGTGKTYALNDYYQYFSAFENSISEDELLIGEIENLSWWKVIAAVLVDLKRAKVTDIMEHKFIKTKEGLSNTNTLRETMWSELQSHTIEECKYVSIANRSQSLIFDKNEDGSWELFEEQAKELVPDAYELSNKIQNYVANPEKEIKRYKFLTFHQSYSYEDFIEGIKPVVNSKAEGDIKYEVQSGIFKSLCQRARNDRGNKYAIFIDEINRGNVSSIFGELITLIEDDKRSGAENELTVTLPYSNELFSVPPNLHIIGTMNTADRSVEALDTALRRRFSFKEMLPDPEVLRAKTLNDSKISLGRLLSTLNDRIEILVDRDHTIGHAFFINVSDLESLKHVFADKVIPLLQEYFYGDYGKMEMVIGKAFFITNDSKVNFADSRYDGEEYSDTKPYHLKTIVKMTTQDFEKAIEELINPGTK